MPCPLLLSCIHNLLCSYFFFEKAISLIHKIYCVVSFWTLFIHIFLYQQPNEMEVNNGKLWSNNYLVIWALKFHMDLIWLQSEHIFFLIDNLLREAHFLFTLSGAVCYPVCLVLTVKGLSIALLADLIFFFFCFVAGCLCLWQIIAWLGLLFLTGFTGMFKQYN